MKALAVASLFLTLAILAWGIFGYPRFAEIGPRVKPRTAIVAPEDFSETSFRSLASPPSEGRRQSIKSAPSGPGNGGEAASAGIAQDESFRIIGSSEGEGGRVWFLKGRLSGAVIAAGEPGSGGYAFNFSEDRASIVSASARYRLEGE